MAAGGCSAAGRLAQALIENYRLFCPTQEWCAKDSEFVSAKSSTLYAVDVPVAALEPWCEQTPLSVRENVSVGLAARERRRTSEADLERVLALLELSDVAERPVLMRASVPFPASEIAFDPTYRPV